METQLESPSIPFTSVPISVPIATASIPLAFGQPGEGMTYVTAGPVPTATLSPQHPIYATSAEGLANGGMMASVHSAMAPVYDTVGHQGDGSPYMQTGSPLSPMDDRGNANTKKNAWTAEEDLTLARIVEECGPGRWTKVAQQLPGRMGKQCRERWFNHLAPEVRGRPNAHATPLPRRPAPLDPPSPTPSPPPTHPLRPTPPPAAAARSRRESGPQRRTGSS